MNLVTLEDESLRDGLQFEKLVVPLEKKLQIFNLLVDAGVRRIQVGSFVNPKVVPQMADTNAFIGEVLDTPDVLVTGLVLNGQGLDRARESGLTHISLSASASDSHSQLNVRKSSKEAVDSVVELIKQATASGIAVRAGLQCVFGCVYEGEIAEEKVLGILERMAGAGAVEFNLADTTGMANPALVDRIVRRVSEQLPEVTLSLHLHDTRGLGIANMVAGYNAGVRLFDTSAGGLGGCPFVKGAAGNVPTEDAVNLFDQMGAPTGINLEKICKVHDYYRELLGRDLPGRMSKVLQAANMTTRTCTDD